MISKTERRIGLAYSIFLLTVWLTLSIGFDTEMEDWLLLLLCSLFAIPMGVYGLHRRGRNSFDLFRLIIGIFALLLALYLKLA